MIIKDHDLVDVEYDKDQFKFTHAQYLPPTWKEVAELKMNQASDGFSQERTQRHIGRIPAMIFLKHPEWSHDPSLIEKWLKTEEGKRYQVSNPDSGRSGKIIIK